MRFYSAVEILLTALLFLAFYIHRTVTFPLLDEIAANATILAANGPPKLAGCICPWVDGDDGCHIIGAGTIPAPSEHMTTGDKSKDAYCANVLTKGDPSQYSLLTEDYYVCPGGIGSPNCKACMQSQPGPHDTGICCLPGNDTESGCEMPG